MKIFIPIILTLLSGCGAIECIDSKVQRNIKPIDKDFLVELSIDGKVESKTIRCEEYYDAMCAERGNYWSIREVGSKNKYQTSSFNVQHPKYGSITLPIPQCNRMVNGPITPLKNLVPSINGKNYWLMSSDGLSRIYKTRKTAPDSAAVIIDLSMKVNGELLE